MSDVFQEIGYDVSTAANGYCALREIRQAIPTILLSDLHMPGLSGFELLSVVRRRFPAILVIAMSGAFVDDQVPSDVPADGFFLKGSSTDALLKILTTAIQTKRRNLGASSASPPGPIQRIESASSSDGRFTIACPDCRRTATQALQGVGILQCVHCGNWINYAIVAAWDESHSPQHGTGGRTMRKTRSRSVVRSQCAS